MKKILPVIMTMLFLPALSQAESACGVGGTAKISGGAIVTRTDAEAAKMRVRIGADGYWWTCAAPTAAPAPVRKGCLPQDSGFRSWTVNGHSCTTANRYATSINDPARDRLIPHGGLGVWQQWQGSMRGMLVERCNDGVRTVATQTCAPVTHCDVLWSYSDGRINYTYDARSKRVPLGVTVNAVAPNGKTLKITCVAGNFVR